MYNILCTVHGGWNSPLPSDSAQAAIYWLYAFRLVWQEPTRVHTRSPSAHMLWVLRTCAHNRPNALPGIRIDLIEEDSSFSTLLLCDCERNCGWHARGHAMQHFCDHSPHGSASTKPRGASFRNVFSTFVKYNGIARLCVVHIWWFFRLFSFLEH